MMVPLHLRIPLRTCPFLFAKQRQGERERRTHVDNADETREGKENQGNQRKGSLLLKNDPAHLSQVSWQE